MSWTYTERLSIDEIKQSARPILLFKHSNRCSISAMAFNRISKYEDDLNLKFDVFLIDVIANRQLSLRLADEIGVEHESPQAIVINHGKVVYAESHMGIKAQDILSLV